MLLTLLSDKIFGPLIGLAALLLVGTGAYFAGDFVGHRSGAAEVQAEWDAAKKTRAAYEDGVAKSVAALSTQLVAAVQAKLDDLDHAQTEAIDAARKADVATVDERCRDVRRGVPSGVVRSLDAIH